MLDQYKILIIEDDTEINNLLSKVLIKENYHVVQAFSGTEGLLYLEKESFDLVLLDLMLPGIMGDKLLVELRTKCAVPVIVISANIDKESKVELLRNGADDYITKPFDIDEVLARIYTTIRRSKSSGTSIDEQSRILRFKDIALNVDSKEVFLGEEEVILTSREYRILELLLSNQNKIFSKRNLFENIWNDQFLGDDNTVTVHISNLRSKLNKLNPEGSYIDTVWGMGYKLKK